MEELLVLINYAAIGLGSCFVWRSIKKVRIFQEEKGKMAKEDESYPLSIQQTKTFDHIKNGAPKMIYLETNSARAFNLNISSPFLRFNNQLHSNFLLGSIDYPSLKCNLGEFDYMMGKEKVKVKISQSRISSGTIRQKCDKIVINNKQTGYFHIQWCFAFQSLSMIGIIKYSIQDQQLIFQPSFLSALTSKTSFLQKVKEFYQLEIFSQRLFQFATVTIIAVNLFVCFDSLKSYFTKKWNSLFNRKQSNNLRQVQVRVEDGFKCLCGQSANIVGECGHLTICSKCLQNGQTCKICEKPILRPMIIYS